MTSLDLINYIKNTIDILSTLKVDEILAKYKKGSNANIPEDYEALLVKEEASLRQHIALENKLKLDYETLNEKINNLEAENNKLKIQIKEQKEAYENKIKEINKEMINITNMKNDIQKNERKLRKKLDIKEKEIFKLQSKLKSISYSNNNNVDFTNDTKIIKNINSNSSFYAKDDLLKELKNNTKYTNKNNNAIENDSKNKVENIENSNIDIMDKKGRVFNKHSTINSNSVHRVNKCNSLSKINYKNNSSDKDNLFNEKNSNNVENDTIDINNNINSNIFNSLVPYNNHYVNGANLSIIKKVKNINKHNDFSNNNIINNKDNKNNILNHSSNDVKDNNENIIIGNINNLNNMNPNNSIDVINIDQKGNNYIKINENKLLLIAQKQSNRLKRTFSAINNHEKNENNNTNIYPDKFLYQKEKIKMKRDITPDRLSNYNKNINNSILKINANNRKFYLLKRTPKKNGYKNSMPNIKGANVYKNNNREINKFQFLYNKIGSNNNLNSNYKIENYSHLKFNDYKRISPQNKIFEDESNFNFNNTNIINNKIIQKEGNINNNIIIINGEIVEQNK